MNNIINKLKNNNRLLKNYAYYLNNIFKPSQIKTFRFASSSNFKYSTSNNNLKNNFISPISQINQSNSNYQLNYDISNLNSIFSEKGLIESRVIVEIEWLKSLVLYFIKNDQLNSKESINDNKIKELINIKLDSIKENFNLESAIKVKNIEKTTNHDVKAVEYYIKSEIEKLNLPNILYEFTHFCCTSEDINNLSFSMLLKKGLDKVYLVSLSELINNLSNFADKYSDISMLCRTHGQSATPSTMGKELANYAYRLNDLSYKLRKIKLKAKMNGAVGNFNAHYVVNPEYDWYNHSKNLLNRLGFEFNPYSTQIENHDSISEVFYYSSLISSVLIDMTRDIKEYQKLGYINSSIINNNNPVS